MSDTATEYEGWTWLYNSTKWHYFREGRSLCRKWGLMGSGHDFQQGKEDSPDNCAACRKARIKELEATS